MIISFEDPSTQKLYQYFIMQYYFQKEEHVVEVLPLHFGIHVWIWPNPRKCLHPELCVMSVTVLQNLLANDVQLQDTKRFCTNDKNFTVLTADTTFNVGDVYVTATTYKNPMLQTRRGTEPVMFGPALLHQRKTAASSSFHQMSSRYVGWNHHSWW